MSDDRVDRLEREVRELRARVDVLEGRASSPPQLRLVRSPTSGHQRGGSPIAALTAGGTLVAKNRGAPMTHEQICEVLKSGRDRVATLGYGLGLVGVAMLPREKWSSQAANVIYMAGDFIRNGYKPLTYIEVVTPRTER